MKLPLLFRGLLVAATLAVALPAAQATPPDTMEERIRRFDVQLRMDADGLLHVREEITWDFVLQTNKHGIYRDIPASATVDGVRRALRFKFEPVLDAEGAVQQVEETMENGFHRLRIGDPEVVVSGERTYVLSYTVERAAVIEAPQDTLNWNALGTGWDVPIDDARAELTIAGGPTIEADCYAGVEGSALAGASCEITPGKVVAVATDLPANTGLTIDARWPHGPIAAPTALDRIRWAVSEHWGVGVLLLALYLLLQKWLRGGRDPRGRSTIVHEYDAPEDLRPAEAGAVVDMSVSNADLSATLVDLAARGYMRIEESGKDYVFRSLKPADDALRTYEAALLTRIFQGGKETASVKELEQTMSATWTEARNTLYETLTERGYFRSNPQTVRLVAMGIGIAVGVLGFFTFGLVGSGYGSVLTSTSIIAAGLLCLGFARALPARTEKGVAAREHILGLKRYFMVAEKERMRFEETESRYSKLLPYALALGVAALWSKRFDGLLRQAPDWYRGTGPFNAAAFGTSITQFSTASAAALSAPKPSSSGGGGGSVGGGGGGGGGGSW